MMGNPHGPTDPKNVHQQLFGLAADHFDILLAIVKRVDEIQDLAEVDAMPDEAENLTKAIWGFLKQYAPGELARDPG
jgi:hypothetical protein